MTATANFDPQEIQRFSAQAAHWWDKKGAFKTLHQLNPLRLQYIAQHSSLSGASVLDIGCGGGILTESLAQQGAIVTGVDMSEPAITVAKLHQHASGVSINYQVTTAEQLATTHPQHYDVITCLEMLEHVPDPMSIIKAVAIMLKPTGCAFFSTINRNLTSYLYAIIGAEYILNMLPKHTHDYAKFIRPSELVAWARHEKLNLHNLTGIYYNVLTKEFSLNSDVRVNYLACFKF